MKYSALYDAVYQRIWASERPTWDSFFDEHASFEQFWTRPFLELALAQVSFPSARPRAIELGCGTGQACCYLAQRGFLVSGIDVSSTAIRIARQQARERGLEIRFECANVASLPGLIGPSDLILDGNCLHCVVFPHERANVYRNVRKLLAPNGYLLISTMVWSEDVKYTSPLLRDEEGVLWMDIAHLRSIMADNSIECDEGRRFGASEYVPYRCFFPPEELRRELSRSGFRIIWERLEPPRQQGAESMFQAILVSDEP